MAKNLIFACQTKNEDGMIGFWIVSQFKCFHLATANRLIDPFRRNVQIEYKRAHRICTFANDVTKIIELKCEIHSMTHLTIHEYVDLPKKKCKKRVLCSNFFFVIFRSKQNCFGHLDNSCLTVAPRSCSKISNFVCKLVFLIFLRIFRVTLFYNAIANVEYNWNGIFFLQ